MLFVSKSKNKETKVCVTRQQFTNWKVCCVNVRDNSSRVTESG